VLGPGVGGRSGRGLLILLQPLSRSVPMLKLQGGRRRDSGRAGPLQVEGTHRGKREITLLNLQEYQNAISSSSSCSSSDSSSSGPSRKNDSRVKWKVSEGLSEIGRDGVDAAYGCAEMGGQAMALQER
jgi:hypothetical protein